MQGIFGGCTSLGSLGPHERNAQKHMTSNQGPFQQIMMSKPSSKMQLQESGELVHAPEPFVPKSQLSQKKQMMNANPANQSANSLQFIYSQNAGHAHQQAQARSFQKEPRDLQSQPRNNSQHEYKHFRTRVVAKQSVQGSVRGGSEHQELENQSTKPSQDEMGQNILLCNRPIQHQQPNGKGQQHFYHMSTNPKLHGSPVAPYQKASHPQGTHGPQTPQKPQLALLSAPAGHGSHHQLLQHHQQAQNFQQLHHLLPPQLKEHQMAQPTQHPATLPGPPNEIKSKHLTNLFSNQTIQNKAIMTRNQSQESSRYNAASNGNGNASQQQMRNSQKLVEAAEQLFMQKQMYLQMLQNLQTAQGPASNGPGPTATGAHGALRQPQPHQNMVSVQEEYRALQAYQRAFNQALQSANECLGPQGSPEGNEITEHAQRRNNHSTQQQVGHSSRKEDPSLERNARMGVDASVVSGDYSEFQDYLVQQQLQQQGDYPVLYAHSKKQRELLKAKEYSQHIANSEHKNSNKQSPEVQHPARSGSSNQEPAQTTSGSSCIGQEESTRTRGGAVTHEASRELNIHQAKAGDGKASSSPRGTPGSKRDHRQNHHQTAHRQLPGHHARSQSGNQHRERHHNNMTISSQLNSGLLFMQNANHEANLKATNKTEDAEQEPQHQQQMIYRSNTSNATNSNVIQILQKELFDKEGSNKDPSGTQVATSVRISGSQGASGGGTTGTGTTTSASFGGSGRDTAATLALNNTSNCRAGSLESKASKTSSELVKNNTNEMNEGPAGLGGGTLKHEETNDQAKPAGQQMVEDQQLSKVSEESFMEDGQQACGAECESEDGDPEMLDAIDEDEDGEGDLGDLDGDSDENDGDDGQDQEAGAKAGNKGSLQNAAQNKGGKMKKDQTKKNLDEDLVVKEKKPAVPRAPWRQKKEDKVKEATEKAKADGQGKTKKNNKILASMPANWAEEEKKFFDSNYEYDPQFVYDSPATNKRFLKMFPAPKFEYLPQAQQIIDKFLETYGSESKYFETEGAQITEKEQVEKYIHEYLEELGPEVKAVARINFSTKNVASTSVTYDNWTSKIRINVQLPIQYREGRIIGVLHHEIGSHFLRRFNEVQQVWHNERKKFGLKSTVTIEEGSGCINMMLEQAKDPKKFTYLFKPALNYYMCCKASELSFKDLFQDLEKYVDNPRQRYKYVLRVKRGLNDTSKPGGLYKDQVYLEGALKLLELRKEIDWHGFYSAKLNLEDLKRPKLMKKMKTDDLVLPKFVEDADEYVRRLDVIAKHNFID